MKKIVMINDLSGIGRCSLTAAIPVVSAMGVQLCPLPTAILSNQTGFASYYEYDFYPHIPEYLEEWKKQKLCPDGIYAGFLSSAKQVDQVLEIIRALRGSKTQILVDPIMGDQGKAYPFYTQAFAERMRALANEADILTPNLTEAMLLIGRKEEMEKNYLQFQMASTQEREASAEELGLRIAQEFGCDRVAVTGIDLDEGRRIGNLICEKGERSWAVTEKCGGSYSGTGDLFASVFLAGILKGIPADRTAQIAGEFLLASIQDAVREGTDRNEGVPFENHLHLLWERRLNIKYETEKKEGRQDEIW